MDRHTITPSDCRITPGARWLPWPACHNVRDLGGLPTSDGGRIRPGALIRADDLVQLTAAGLAALRASGVRRVLDLRDSKETGRQPSPVAGEPCYRWTPFIDEQAERYRNRAAETSLLDLYLGSLERNGGTIATAIGALADAPPGGVLVHCVAGKDRTGVLVALALRVAGVGPAEIAADYARSDERAPFLVELAALADDAAREAFRNWHGCRPELMRTMLDHLDRGYGGVAGYLRRHGVTDAQLAALRTRLRDERSTPLPDDTRLRDEREGGA